MRDRGARVLIVDDTEANRYALRRFVERAGHQVFEAATGEDGFAITDREHPDVVVLDVNLPDVDGFTVCRRIKTNAHTMDVPVIQVSASYVGAVDQVKGLEGGADAYLTQPIEPAVLLATIEAVLRAHHVERELRRVQLQLDAALHAAGMQTFCVDWPSDRADRATQPDGPLRGPFVAARSFEAFMEGVFAEDRDSVRERITKAIADRKEFEIEYRVLERGELRWRLERGRTTAQPGGAIQLLGVSMDVTERKALLESLLEADQRKDEFLAMLAHELRNPLAPIRNAARVLSQLPRADENSQAMLAVIERQAKQMARLVDDLLDVSRITRGKIELKPEILQFATVLDHAIETTRPLIDSRKHELLVVVPTQPIWVHVDFARLGQAVANILSNAAKYTEPGGRIEVELRIDDDKAVLTVKDNGIGIPPQLLPKVFELFMQGDRTLDRAQGGLGIGLALVKSLIEFHRGTVIAQSEGTGRGTTFVMTLPLAREPASDAQVESETSNGAARKRRVLIVEDNRDAAASMATLLMLGNHEVRVAYSGLEALHMAGDWSPEIVFLDIGLPGMSGLEVVRRMRGHASTARSTIIAVTGYGQPQDHRRSLEAGFDKHLVKPLDPAVVDGILRE